MNKPQIRMWIDAKNEKLDYSQYSEEIFIIDNLEQEETKKLLSDTLFPFVKEIIYPDFPQNAVKITYNHARVSLSFIKYCLLQKNIIFKCDNG